MEVNLVNQSDETPLHVAALHNKGALVAKDMDGCTPMHYAAIKGNAEIVKILLTSGNNKNIDDRNVWRKTALHIAAEHGHSDLINLLLSYGAAMNALDTPCCCHLRNGKARLHARRYTDSGQHNRHVQHDAPK
uniref:Ankyrin repeat protein n=1 Tax=Calidris pygmaea TaxID=425635 RepID=A0A8C3PQM8_9CHAR